jgi:hypothetical protein
MKNAAPKQLASRINRKCLSVIRCATMSGEAKLNLRLVVWINADEGLIGFNVEASCISMGEKFSEESLFTVILLTYIQGVQQLS